MPSFSYRAGTDPSWPIAAAEADHGARGQMSPYPKKTSGSHWAIWNVWTEMELSFFTFSKQMCTKTQALAWQHFQKSSQSLDVSRRSWTSANISYSSWLMGEKKLSQVTDWLVYLHTFVATFMLIWFCSQTFELGSSIFWAPLEECFSTSLWRIKVENQVSTGKDLKVY